MMIVACGFQWQRWLQCKSVEESYKDSSERTVQCTCVSVSVALRLLLTVCSVLYHSKILCRL